MSPLNLKLKQVNCTPYFHQRLTHHDLGKASLMHNGGLRRLVILAGSVNAVVSFVPSARRLSIGDHLHFLLSSYRRVGLRGDTSVAWLSPDSQRSDDAAAARMNSSISLFSMLPIIGRWRLFAQDYRRYSSFFSRRRYDPLSIKTFKKRRPMGAQSRISAGGLA